MKKVVAMVSALSISCILFGCDSTSKFPASKVTPDTLPAQVSMSDLTANQDVMIEYQKDDPEQIAMITGKFSDIQVQNEQDAACVIASMANVLGIKDVSQEILFVDRQDVKGQSLTAYTFRQFYENVPVMSEVLKVMVDQSGTPTILMNGYHAMIHLMLRPPLTGKRSKNWLKTSIRAALTVNRNRAFHLRFMADSLFLYGMRISKTVW